MTTANNGHNVVVESTIDEVVPLLSECGLLVDDLDPKLVEFLAVHDGAGKAVGSIGLERHGSQVLLRSLAVEGHHRRQGIGVALVEAALVRAKSEGATETFVVTTDAAKYFEQFGFETIEREAIHGEVADSSQLTGACPNDAIVMAKRLPPVVLFMCVHNAGRSQMAAAFLARRAGGYVDVRSAGSEPAHQLNPSVVAAMTELGIDISVETPKLMTFDMAREADVVITMGCGDACPVFPGKRYLDWELVDPAGKSVEEVRAIRDEIEQRVQALVEELGITFPR